MCTHYSEFLIILKYVYLVTRTHDTIPIASTIATYTSLYVGYQPNIHVNYACVSYGTKLST